MSCSLGQMTRIVEKDCATRASRRERMVLSPASENGLCLFPCIEVWESSEIIFADIVESRLAAGKRA